MRRGISLLEVLVSIGVLLVGFVGAATLLPIAKFYSTEANKYNRASVLGQVALHDLQIRGYLSPKKWVDPAGAFGFVNSSFLVVDPLGMSYAAANGQPQPVFFPAWPYTQANPPPAGVPSMFRCNLDISNAWPDSADTPIKPNPLAMPFAEADRIFRLNDDLIFDVPTNGDDRPRATSGSLSPDYAGDYSYFFTMSHTPADLNNAKNMQRFLVSIVVCYKRDLTLFQGGLPQGATPPERLVLADFLQPASPNTPFYDGGALFLRTNQGKEWLLNIKPNTYMMLVSNFADAVVGPAGHPRMGWYRIVSVDEGPQPVQGQSGFFGRVVTVAGADWPPLQYLDPVTGVQSQLWIDADVTSPPPSPPFPSGSGEPATVFAALMTDVIAVYDDLIMVDNSLLRH